VLERHGRRRGDGRRHVEDLAQHLELAPASREEARSHYVEIDQGPHRVREAPEDIPDIEARAESRRQALEGAEPAAALALEQHDVLDEGRNQVRDLPPGGELGLRVGGGRAMAGHEATPALSRGNRSADRNPAALTRASTESSEASR
jgi:hypothetical protein